MSTVLAVSSSNIYTVPVNTEYSLGFDQISNTVGYTIFTEYPGVISKVKNKYKLFNS